MFEQWCKLVSLADYKNLREAGALNIYKNNNYVIVIWNTSIEISNLAFWLLKMFLGQ